jgi:predicted metal-dependent HD superfamily phosphohydrolase
MSNGAFIEKRVEVLSSFLIHETIFASRIMKYAFEVQSRKNMTWEIELLSRGIIPSEK